MTSEQRSTHTAPPRGASASASGCDTTSTAGIAERPRPGAARPADFGPRGYLPDKAARRARKIVLRAPMGLQWPVAAAGTAVLLAVVGAVYLLTASGPPRAPYVTAGPLDAVDPRGAAVLDLPDATPADAAASDRQTDEHVREALVVRGGGGLAAFAAPAGGAVWCADSRRIEGDRRVWTAEGRLVGGDGASLRPLPVQVHAGTLFIDPTAPRRAFPPAHRGETPVCT